MRRVEVFPAALLIPVKDYVNNKHPRVLPLMPRSFIRLWYCRDVYGKPWIACVNKRGIAEYFLPLEQSQQNL